MILHGKTRDNIKISTKYKELLLKKNNDELKEANSKPS